MRWRCAALGLAFFAVAASLWADPWSDDDPIRPSPPPVVNPQPTPEGRLITLAIGPVGAVPLSAGTAGEYNPGGGGEVELCYAASPSFSIGLDAGFLDYTVNPAYLAKYYQSTYGVSLPSGTVYSGDWNYEPLMALAKYYLGPGGGVRPYLLLGAGIGVNKVSLTATFSNGTASQTSNVTVSENALLLAPGFGADFRVSAGLELFAQARLDMEFTALNPVDAVELSGPGGNSTRMGSLSNDCPTVFLPVQVGARL